MREVTCAMWCQDDEEDYDEEGVRDDKVRRTSVTFLAANCSVRLLANQFRRLLILISRDKGA